jgi:DNA-binding MarR family transcriptional regulator
MDFFAKTGKKAIGSRLRMLTTKITEDAALIYKMYEVELAPKWFPVFYVLSGGEEKAITEIAAEIGHTQPSVSQLVREMGKSGLLTEQKDPADGRRNLVKLTEKGLAMAPKIELQYLDVSNAIEELGRQSSHDLWKALEEWEFLLGQQTLLARVKAQRAARESQRVQIVAYQPEYREAFRRLNQEWIERYFVMEAADHKALDDPEASILAKGGHILVALYEQRPVGVCALVKMADPDYGYELAKMAVSPAVQGRGVGGQLGQAAIAKAKSLGAKALYLESNTQLEPAIQLYYKLGFKKVTDRPSPYKRSNIQMQLDLA